MFVVLPFPLYCELVSKGAAAVSDASAVRTRGPAGRVNGCRYETVYANLHLLVILVQAATRCWKRPANAERTLTNTTIHSTVTTRAKGRPLGSINM